MSGFLVVGGINSVRFSGTRRVEVLDETPEEETGEEFGTNSFSSSHLTWWDKIFKVFRRIK